MPPILRAIVAQFRGGGRCTGARRNFSSSTDQRVESVMLGDAKWIAYNVTRLVTFVAGYKAAPFIIGEDIIPSVEESRQKMEREFFGESAEVVDEREKMWSFLSPENVFLSGRRT